MYPLLPGAEKKSGKKSEKFPKLHLLNLKGKTFLIVSSPSKEKLIPEKIQTKISQPSFAIKGKTFMNREER